MALATEDAKAQSHATPADEGSCEAFLSLLSNPFLLNQPHFFVVPVLHRFAMIKSPFMLINPSFWWIHRNHWCFITIFGASSTS